MLLIKLFDKILGRFLILQSGEEISILHRQYCSLLFALAFFEF